MYMISASGGCGTPSGRRSMTSCFGRVASSPLAPLPEREGGALVEQPPKRFPQSLIPNRRSRGFTLLEVLLALGLSGVVIAAIGTAIYVHMHAFDAGRSDVEEAQLARALLSRIADDIRGAVPYDPVQAEKLLPKTTTGQAVTSAAAATGVSATDISKAAEEAGVTPSASTDTGSGDTSSGDTQDLASSTVLPTIPGIYGKSNILMVDVSRLPRLDQYDAFLVQTGDSPQFDRLSDVKNVKYYVNSPAGLSSMGTSGNRDPNSGLVRRELDRAVAAWANQQGGLDEMQADPAPMAPEVAEIAFRYFDGANDTWVDEWYTDGNGGLPTAVEIAIAIIPAAAQRAKTTSWMGALSSQTPNCDQLHWYRMVVYLPGSEPGQGTANSGTTEESADQSTGDGTTPGGTTPGGTTPGGTTPGGTTPGGTTPGGAKPGGTTPGGTTPGGKDPGTTPGPSDGTDTDPTKKGPSR